MNTLILMLLFIFITGCSNKVVYENLRLNNQQKCVQEGRLTYLECIKLIDTSYETYEIQRQQVLETDNLN